MPPAAATSASVAHLKVKGMATVTSLATSISTSESTTVRCRSGRSDGQMYGDRARNARRRRGAGVKARDDGRAQIAARVGVQKLHGPCV